MLVPGTGTEEAAGDIAEGIAHVAHQNDSVGPVEQRLDPELEQHRHEGEATARAQSPGVAHVRWHLAPLLGQ